MVCWMCSWALVLNCELWPFYQREEVAIPGKTLLFNAVIIAA
jgi:hypothetical protein